MAVDERPQRGQAFIDRDLMDILITRWGMSAGKAATEVVGKVTHEVGERGIVAVTYGDLRSEVGEAFLRVFIDQIIETHPETFNDELYARAKRGGNARRDEPMSNHIKPSAEQIAEIRDRVRHAF